MNAPAYQELSVNEIIEPVNHYLHNPIASNIVKTLKNTWVTPNQVTYISVFVGLLAALFFSSGSTQSFFFGGFLLEVAMILDCVDGQLARAKNCASDWGRLLDGIAGYIIYLAVLLGLIIGLGRYYGELIVIGVITVLRAISYDYCKLTMVTMVQKGVDGNQKEILDTCLKIKKNNSTILKIYFYYLQFQRFIFCGHFTSRNQFNENEKFICEDNALTIEQRKRYRKKISPLMIVWSWHGVDFPIFLLALLSIFGVLEIFLKPLAYIFTLQFFTTMIYHRFQERSFFAVL